MTIDIDLDDCDGVVATEYDGVVATEYDDTDDLYLDGLNVGKIDFPIDGFTFNQ